MKNSRDPMIIATAFSGGGAEVVARYMVDEIKGAYAVVFENTAGIQLSNRRVHVIDLESRGSAASKILVNFWRLLVIQYLKLVERPRVTISHLEGPNFANLLTVGGGRKVIFVHNSVSQNYQERTGLHSSKRALVRMSYKMADLVCCVSEDVQFDLVQNYGVPESKVTCLPNPIDCNQIVKDSFIRYSDSRDGLWSGEYLISVASLTPQKNHSLLIHVFHKLIRTSVPAQDLKLVLVGEGPEKARLMELCANLKIKYSCFGDKDFDLSAQVLFFGFQANPHPLLSRAKLLILPSLWEGLPICLLETMTLGVPSIVADCSTAIQKLMQFSAKTYPEYMNRGFAMTNYGILVRNFSVVDESTINHWVEILDGVLGNSEYLGLCAKSGPIRAAEYDIRRIMSLWNKQLLQ